jgi:hypothetical protein
MMVLEMINRIKDIAYGGLSLPPAFEVGPALPYFVAA